MIDFPTGPTDNQQFVSPEGAIYVWKATPGVWEAYTGSPAATGSGGVVLQFSPQLTGDPTAPTPAPGDNDTSIATTAFVNAALATALNLALANVAGAVLPALPDPEPEP
jgi:hypothetical protein